MKEKTDEEILNKLLQKENCEGFSQEELLRKEKIELIIKGVKGLKERKALSFRKKNIFLLKFARAFIFASLFFFLGHESHNFFNHKSENFKGEQDVVAKNIDWQVGEHLNIF